NYKCAAGKTDHCLRSNGNCGTDSEARRRQNMTQEELLTAYRPDEDAQKYVALAQTLETRGETRTAATAYDRAFGLSPGDIGIAKARRHLLDQLSVTENGILFRYIPAGTF